MPIVKVGVLRSLADEWVLDDRVAEVVNHCRDGEHPAQSVVQTRLSHQPSPSPSRRSAGCTQSEGSTGGSLIRFTTRGPPQGEEHFGARGFPRCTWTTLRVTLGHAAGGVSLDRRACR